MFEMTSERHQVPKEPPRKGTRVPRGVLFFRNIPRPIKDKFKSVCARRGDSMQDVIHALMRLYCLRPESIKIKGSRKVNKRKRKPRERPPHPFPNHPHFGSQAK